ncbi:MAG: hypothetical protein K8L91_12705 [Anaerolineae bacterium]|nr:hypothetical protein [Anaerolineae bacterium]
MRNHWRGRLFAVWILLCLVLAGNMLPPATAQTTSQWIESDDSRVTREGEWTLQTTGQASGGAYLFSGTASPDSHILSLAFAGPSIEVWYIAGPTMGTMAIEVDGTVLRTVITTQDTTQFSQRAVIDYLSDENHMLRVYPAAGIIAVDAFYAAAPYPDTANASESVGPRVTCDSDTTIHRVSISSGGAGGNHNSEIVAISGDGRYVAFESVASNLVSGDTNGQRDIFRRDRQTCTTMRVSVTNAGGQSSGGVSTLPAVSGDGRYVAFTSTATNLVGGDTNNQEDVFVRDTVANTTIRVSISTGGTQANGPSSYPTISSDGRYVAFESTASNLVTGDNNGLSDIFVRDIVGNTTIRVSVTNGGAQASGGDSYDPAISGNGRYVAFATYADNLASGDTNGDEDVYVRDLVGNTTFRVSLRDDEAQATGGISYNPAISYDGRYVAFGSNATNLYSPDSNGAYDVFLRDTVAGTTRLASVSLTGGTGAGPTLSNSTHATVSQDGRFVAFQSFANNLVANDTNGAREIFVRDMSLNVTTRLSVTETGQQSGESDSSYPAMSFNGRYVAFEAVEQLVSTDTTYFNDAYVAINQAALPTVTDTLVLANRATNAVSFIDTLDSPPLGGDYYTYTANAPAAGRYLMGDWDGNGTRTPGIYGDNGVFYFTNTSGPGATWSGFWVGLFGRPPVAGRFSSASNHDCFGVVDSGNFPPYGLAFALYFTCDLTSGPTPSFTVQWLSVLLPDNQGFTGTHQFGSGEFNGDGVDSIAVRRGAFIAWTNVPPTTLLSEFSLAQYIGAPGSSDEGTFVVGDWDGNNLSSFGLFYQNGAFYRRNDLDWNTGIYLYQQVGQPIGTTGIGVDSWRSS